MKRGQTFAVLLFVDLGLVFLENGAQEIRLVHRDRLEQRGHIVVILLRDITQLGQLALKEVKSILFQQVVKREMEFLASVLSL
jgi:hypothetical protein